MGAHVSEPVVFVAAGAELAEALSGPLRARGLRVRTFDARAPFLAALAGPVPEAMVVDEALPGVSGHPCFLAPRPWRPRTVALLADSAMARRGELLRAGLGDVIVGGDATEALQRVLELVGQASPERAARALSLPAELRVGAEVFSGHSIDVSAHTVNLRLPAPVPRGAVAELTLRVAADARVELFTRVLATRSAGTSSLVSLRVVALTPSERAVITGLARPPTLPLPPPTLARAARFTGIEHTPHVARAPTPPPVEVTERLRKAPLPIAEEDPEDGELLDVAPPATEAPTLAALLARDVAEGLFDLGDEITQPLEIAPRSPGLTFAQLFDDVPLAWPAHVPSLSDAAAALASVDPSAAFAHDDAAVATRLEAAAARFSLEMSAPERSAMRFAAAPEAEAVLAAGGRWQVRHTLELLRDGAAHRLRCTMLMLQGRQVLCADEATELVVDAHAARHVLDGARRWLELAGTAAARHPEARALLEDPRVALETRLRGAEELAAQVEASRAPESEVTERLDLAPDVCPPPVPRPIGPVVFARASHPQLFDFELPQA